LVPQLPSACGVVVIERTNPNVSWRKGNVRVDDFWLSPVIIAISEATRAGATERFAAMRGNGPELWIEARIWRDRIEARIVVDIGSRVV
jgi:hypothetical protein